MFGNVVMDMRIWLGSGLISAGLVFGLMAGPAAAQTRTLPDFTDLVEQVGPSVVNIRTTEKVQPRSSQGNPAEEEMLEFFRRFGVPTPNMPRPGPRQRTPQQQDEQQREQPRGVGSGFVLTSDGLIMTNAHVVEGAEDVIVTLTDKREFKAKIIGSDKRSDVALVKIEASGLPVIRAGDVGRLAIALDDYAVAVIAKLARTQPGCTVSFEDVAKLAQSSNGLVYRARLIERVFVKIDVEVNTKVVQGCSDFVEHKVDASGPERLLRFGFWQSKNVFGGLGQHA